MPQPKPTTIRFSEENEQALQLLQEKMGFETRTDLVNSLVRAFSKLPIEKLVQQAKEKGFESFEIESMEEPLREITVNLCFYHCAYIGEIGDPTTKRYDFPSYLSELPCIKNPSFECLPHLIKKAYQDDRTKPKEEIEKNIEFYFGDCPLREDHHPEWRTLFSKGLSENPSNF